MNGVPVARILGFEIRLHISWIFIVAIVTVTVANRLTDFEPAIDPSVSWGVGLVGSIGFMLCTIVHELAHAVVARRDGATTEVVVVHFVGSPAPVDIVASSPRAEAAVALAGPLASVVLGLILVGLAFAVVGAGEATGPLADVLVIVGALNLILAGVSIVPAFPLDGGRVVRAVGWARSGSQRTGTRVAGVIGRYVGMAALFFGLVVIVATDNAVDGIMIGLIGWFLMASARSVDRWLILDNLIQGMSVGEAMEQQLETISPQLTLDTFASSVLDGTVSPALPVVHADLVVGIVGLAQLRAVPARAWPSTRTEDIMVGGSELPTVGPDDRLSVALERLRESHLDGLPVLDGGRLRGVLTRRSIATLLHARAETTGQTL